SSAVQDSDQETAGDPCEPDAEGGADQSEQHAFGKELAHDAGSSGSNGETDGELALAGGGAGEQQVRDVRAGDQQDQRDYTHQYQKRLAESVAEAGVTGTAGGELRGGVKG